jgi:hypothetical protein
MIADTIVPILATSSPRPEDDPTRAAGSVKTLVAPGNDGDFVAQQL